MSLELIIGPMSSGKTTELKRRIDRQRIAGKKVCIIKHSADDRAKKNKDIHMHSGLMLKADFVTDNLSKQNVEGYDVVGIDEGHFFSSLEIVDEWANRGIYVVIAALVSNSDREAFIHPKGVSPVLELVAKCERITPLRAVCVPCKGEAHFTRKRSGKKSKSVIDVGGLEKYEAVCRKCYNKKLD